MQDPYGSSGTRNPFPPFAPVDLNDKNQAFSFPMPFAWFKEDWRVGYSQAWNLTLERQLGTDFLLRAAYVGNKGTNLQSFRERNWAIYSPTATVANTNAWELAVSLASTYCRQTLQPQFFLPRLLHLVEVHRRRKR